MSQNSFSDYSSDFLKFGFTLLCFTKVEPPDNIGSTGFGIGCASAYFVLLYSYSAVSSLSKCILCSISLETASVLANNIAFLLGLMPGD